ncbi:MAG: ATP-dependent 6-phosphofructokinase [Lentisphaerota bacterium]
MQDTTISNLGECKYKSPLNLKVNPVEADDFGFVSESEKVRFSHEVDIHRPPVSELLFEKAGPREKIFFDPAEIRAAIVTCGGLCPGLNNVIRSAFLCLQHAYGVKEVLGIRYGYQGLNPAIGEAPILLNADMVDRIHQEGGTILGSSRGDQPIPVMVDFLVKNNISMIFTVGGDGTQRGAQQITEEVGKRGLKIAVVGIPKTIDNDIMYVKRSFGYTTASDMAHEVLTCAHTEAKSYPNGIGLVKLMGRDSGFIAAGATIASQDVNFTIIPEIPLVLEGEKGLLETLKRRILKRKHAVIAVAEGAGQDLLANAGKDASGNVLHGDIGVFLKDKIVAYFKEQKIPVNMKYIDPSYIIRSVHANAEDSFLCDQYARGAVHAAMAGKTGLIIGLWNGFIHLPIPLATGKRQYLKPEGYLWNCVISSTGQPSRWV